MNGEVMAATRRHMLGVATAAAGLLAAACGGQQGSTGTTPAGGAKPGGKITWSFWSANAEAVQSMLDQIKEFRVQNPTVEVEPVYTTSGQPYRDKVTAMITAGTPPDAMIVDAYWMPAFVESKMIQKLDPYLKADKSYKLDAFMPGAVLESHHVFKGVYYALPEAPESPRVLFYNGQRVVESGGADPNELEAQGKWTWESYADLATRMTKGQTPDRYFGTRDYLTSSAHWSFIASNGGKLLSDDLKTFVGDSPDTLAALQFQADLIHKLRVAPPPGENVGAGDALASGRVAMMMSGAWAAAPYVALKDLDWNVAPLPRSPKGVRKTLYKPNAITIPTGVSGQQAATAWELLKFVAGPVYEKALIDAGVNLTNLKELVDYFLKKSPIRNARVFMDAFDKKEVAPLPLFTKWSDYEAVVNDELGKARRGEVGVPAAVNAIKPRVAPLLAG